MELQNLVQVGLIKITMVKEEPFRFLIRSILAGFYLGIAMILSYTLGALFIEDPAISKLLLSATFGIGIVTIALLGADLFTGNCLYTIMCVYDKRVKFSGILSTWALCYIGNLLGMFIIGSIFMVSQQESSLFADYLQPLFDTKLSSAIIPLFAKAVLCNFIVCVSSYACFKLKSETAKIIMSLFLICAFLIAGFEHCIANGGFFTMCLVQYGFALDYTALPIHLLISTIGNIIGGSVMLGLPLYLVLREKK